MYGRVPHPQSIICPTRTRADDMFARTSVVRLLRASMTRTLSLSLLTIAVFYCNLCAPRSPWARCGRWYAGIHVLLHLQGLDRLHSRRLSGSRQNGVAEGRALYAFDNICVYTVTVCDVFDICELCNRFAYESTYAYVRTIMIFNPKVESYP